MLQIHCQSMFFYFFFLHWPFHSDYRQLKNTFGHVSVAKNHGDQDEIIFKAEITSFHKDIQRTSNNIKRSLSDPLVTKLN